MFTDWWCGKIILKESYESKSVILSLTAAEALELISQLSEQLLCTEKLLQAQIECDKE